ncbi:MAG: hypothetical protein AB8H80_19185 [Planctomycetota bacterium]
MLPPAIRILVGAGLVAMGVVSLVLQPASLLAWVVAGVGGLVGAPLLLMGWTAWREQRADCSQLERAREELDVLRVAIRQVQHDKRGVERFLLERGYSSQRARRWIASECDVSLPLRHRLG